MWKRMIEPGLIVLALLDLVFSWSVASIAVRGLDWRYVDALALTTTPFDASGSLMAFTLLGSVLWPVLALLLWLLASDLIRHIRSRVG